MCLRVYAVPSEPAQISARRLAETTGLAVKKQGDELHFAKLPGCSCSLLTDSADWAHECWDLVPDVLEPLATGLELLHQEARGFTFQAVWEGDEVETESRVRLHELLKDVRENRVKNKHRYQVGRAG